MPPPRLILASGSPRRRDFLEWLGLRFDVVPAEIDESVHPQEPARAYVGRLASEKAAAVAARHPGAVVLAADTTVVLDGEVLGKPESADEAKRMLRALSGRTHQVLTAVALDGTGRGAAVVETQVTFKTLSDGELDWYIASQEPMDKAGAYAIQGRGGVFVARIDGSHSNVVGLPLVETVALLQSAGVVLPWQA